MNDLAKKTKRLDLCWIKAHVGHIGNEKADELAKRGTTSVIIYNFPHLSRVGKLLQKEKMYEIRTKRCRQTKVFYERPDPVRSKINILTLAISQLTVLIQKNHST